MEIILIGVLVVVVFYIAFCNYVLCKGKEELRKELHQAHADLYKLKLLNKLKVDWDGNPIHSQSSLDQAYDKVVDRYKTAIEELSKND